MVSSEVLARGSAAAEVQQAASTRVHAAGGQRLAMPLLSLLLGSVRVRVASSPSTRSGLAQFSEAQIQSIMMSLALTLENPAADNEIPLNVIRRAGQHLYRERLYTVPELPVWTPAMAAATTSEQRTGLASMPPRFMEKTRVQRQEDTRQRRASANASGAAETDPCSQYGIVKGPLSVKAYRENSKRVAEYVAAEVNALRSLRNSPFVVALVFENSSARLPRLGTEHCERGDLYSLIQEEGPFTEMEVRLVASQLVLALDHLAQHDIVHGDIKPEHIGLTLGNHLKLIDFSRSKMLEGAASVLHSSGTLPYASPEVLETRQCTRASDWFAVGVVVFEMFFGTLPFMGKTDEETARRVCSERLRFPAGSSCTKDIRCFITHCLEKKPQQRLSTLSKCHDHDFFNNVDWTQVHEEAKALES
ncbi:Protein kinase, putative [Hondaea fermentalgiana]|uniref:Protein kinase, putative n=1 Tax=Hondaea fermentalgiana TaxID=2315210 RepID=A0A2R5G993_9STRA|nr:Protein kinase, putative [Hondaea fermentalgiana]|eukprot:GBG27580.1 Protein kinase, putative [Hondaea fermentalgiana]